MKKQTLNEEISRMKSIMKKLLNENEFSYNQMDDTHPEHELPMDDSNEIVMDDEDDEDNEDHMCSRCNGTGEGSHPDSTCASCGGSGVKANDNSYDDYDGPDDDYDPSDVEGKEWGGIDY
jgi:hypothetical protein